MRVIAGARAIHISISYDLGAVLEDVIERIDISESWLSAKQESAVDELEKFGDLLTQCIVKGRAKGYPLPPLPNYDWPVVVEPGDPRPVSTWELMQTLTWVMEQCQAKGFHHVVHRIAAVLEVDLDAKSTPGDDDGGTAEQGSSGVRRADRGTAEADRGATPERPEDRAGGPGDTPRQDD